MYLRSLTAAAIIAGWVLVGATASAQQPAPAPAPPGSPPQPSDPPAPIAAEPPVPDPVPPAADGSDLAELRQRIDALEATVRAAREGRDQARATIDELSGELATVTSQLEELTGKVRGSEGRIRFLLAGTTVATMSLENDNTWRYAALFAPHFFWSFYDRVLFEAHLDLRVADGTTGVNLEFAALWLILTDHLVIGAGKILTPFGFYNEQLHTTWLNRLPDEPLSVADHVGPSPTHFVGVNLRGVHHVRGRRVAWSAYVGSAPVAEQPAMPAAPAGHTHDPPTVPVAPPIATGGLDYDRYHRWSAGGRVGYFPIAAAELGASVHVARVDPVSSPLDRIVVATYGLDGNYNAVVSALEGTVDAHVEWVVSRAHPTDRDQWPEDRTRQGLYAQVAYRPSEVERVHMSRLEAVLRYDRLDDLRGAAPTHRYTAGLNYWIQPSLVAKAALGITDPDAGESRRRLMVQLAGGF